MSRAFDRFDFHSRFVLFASRRLFYYKISLNWSTASDCASDVDSGCDDGHLSWRRRLWVIPCPSIVRRWQSSRRSGINRSVIGWRNTDDILQIFLSLISLLYSCVEFDSRNKSNVCWYSSAFLFQLLPIMQTRARRRVDCIPTYELHILHASCVFFICTSVSLSLR